VFSFYLPFILLCLCIYLGPFIYFMSFCFYIISCFRQFSFSFCFSFFSFLTFFLNRNKQSLSRMYLYSGSAKFRRRWRRSFYTRGNVLEYVPDPGCVTWFLLWFPSVFLPVYSSLSFSYIIPRHIMLSLATSLLSIQLRKCGLFLIS